MLLEFCENGSARQFAPHETKYSFGDAFKHMSICWKFTEEMISALVYVHNRDVIHRDLKLDNVLIHADGRFKLTDFGLSTGRHEELQKLRDASLEPAVFDETHLSKIETLRTNSQCGTMLYMAPEIFSGGTYGKAVDLYALGLAVREMLAHHSIATFQDVNVRHLVYNGEPIVPPASEILCLLICAAPLVAHRHLYAFLAVHTVLFILSSLFMRRLILLRIANCMTSKDPAARLTSAQHLQYMSNSKVVVEVVYPVLFAAVVLLYPFDMRGNVAASLLLDCIFIVHLVFSLVWYPSLLLTAAAVERAKLQ